MRGHHWPRRIALLALGLLWSHAADAQRLSVQIRDTVLGTPVVAALVTATEQGSGAQVFALTNDAGRAWLVLDRPGLWAASVRRIGLRPARMPAIPVDSAQTQSVTIRTSSMQFALPGMRVEASAVCGSAPSGDATAAVLWDQMTLALRASTLAPPDSGRTRALQVELFERRLDRRGQRVSHRVLRSGTGTARPFFAADPDTLATRGYVRRDSTGALEYFAPDERVMLSDAFVSTHCFEVPRKTASPQLAELRFTPLARRTVPDVSGTAYIDVATGELRRITFRFVNVERLIGDFQSAGGEVVLNQLSDGRWIVAEWTLRMPTFVLAASRWDRIHTGYREVGGAISPARLLFASDSLSLTSPGAASEDSVPDMREGTTAHTVEQTSGFALRRSREKGVFLDAAGLARLTRTTAAHSVVQLLAGLPGVTVFRVPEGLSAAPTTRDPDLVREWRVGADLPMVQMRDGEDDGHPVCIAKLFVDGTRATLAQLALMQVGDVMALELYRDPQQVPRTFRIDQNECGTIVLWTVNLP